MGLKPPVEKRCFSASAPAGGTVTTAVTPLILHTQSGWAGGPTGDGGSEAAGLENHEAVLQAAPAHSLGTNQNQSLPLEGRDLGHLLVDLQLVSVKLWRGGVIDDKTAL